MSDQVLIRTGEGDWAEPTSIGYADEDSLQALLAAHPTLLPGVVGESAVCREFHSGVGSADIVIVDAEGSITLVECKLAANRQVRREVIGQVLDYASRLWQMPLESFLDQWARCGGTALQDTLGEDSEAALQQLADSLATGRFRIILAVDGINDDLMRIVTYLNAVTVPDTSIVAVEFRRIVQGAVEILMPRSFGAELADEKAGSAVPSKSRPRWTVDDYLDWCAEHDPSGAPVVRAMLEQFEADGWRIGGGRAASPSLNLSSDVRGLGRRWPIIFYTDARLGAQVEVRYSDFAKLPQVADGLLQHTADRFPLGLDPARIREQEYHRRPSFLAHILNPSQGRDLAAQVTAWTSHPGGTPASLREIARGVLPYEDSST